MYRPGALDLLKAHPWLVEVFVCWRHKDDFVDPALESKFDDLRRLLAPDVDFTLPQDRDDLPLLVCKKRHPEDVELVQPHLAQVRSEWSRPGLDIDKTWRRILEDLSRCPEDVARVCTAAVSGGTPLGPNLGYAPAEFHEDSGVQRLALELPTAAAQYAALGAVEVALNATGAVAPAAKCQPLATASRTRVGGS